MTAFVLYTGVWNTGWQQILFRLFYTKSFLQWISIKCTAQNLVLFHSCFFTQLNNNLQTLWVCTRSCFTTCIIKAPMKLKLLFLYCLFSWANWFLSLFPLRFHQHQQQNWFYIDHRPCSSHPPSHGWCIFQLCPERILTRTTGFKALCFRWHFGLNLSSSFFASWWRNYLWVIQWLF